MKVSYFYELFSLASSLGISLKLFVTQSAHENSPLFEVNKIVFNPNFLAGVISKL